jgi:hypothetical protein
MGGDGGECITTVVDAIIDWFRLFGRLMSTAGSNFDLSSILSLAFQVSPYR